MLLDFFLACLALGCIGVIEYPWPCCWISDITLLIHIETSFIVFSILQNLCRYQECWCLKSGSIWLLTLKPRIVWTMLRISGLALAAFLLSSGSVFWTSFVLNAKYCCFHVVPGRSHLPYFGFFWVLPLQSVGVALPSSTLKPTGSLDTKLPGSTNDRMCRSLLVGSHLPATKTSRGKLTILYRYY